MIEARILKNGIQTHAAEFANQSDAEAWVNQTKVSGAFGKLERWLKQSEFTTEQLHYALDSDERDDGMYYKFAQEFTVEFVDITAEKLAAKKIEDRTKKRRFGQMLIDKIATMNDAKGLNHEQVDAFMLNPLIVNLKAHLEAGNIDTFIFKLNNSNVSAFFTAEEKAAVILQCETFLSNLGG